MMMGIDYLPILNIVFSLIIAVGSYMVYRHWVDPLLLYLGMAFLVFGISNLIQIIGITNQEVLILFQLFAFILIMYGLYSEWKYFKSSQDQDEYESPPDE